MCALIHNLFLHTRQSIENDGSGSTFDIVKGGLGNAEGRASGDNPSEKTRWKSHCGCAVTMTAEVVRRVVVRAGDDGKVELQS